MELVEEDKHKTSFSEGNFEFYVCNRMCFGLTKDLANFSKTFEEHFQRLERAFKKNYPKMG